MRKRKKEKSVSGKARSAKTSKPSFMKSKGKLPSSDESLSINSADVSPPASINSLTTDESAPLPGEALLPWPEGMVIPKDEDPFPIHDPQWVAATVIYEFSDFLNEFKVSRNTVKMWMRERWLGYSTPGGMTYILKSDMLAMLKRFYNPPLLWIGCISSILENWEFCLI